MIEKGKLNILSPLDAAAHGMEGCLILSASLAKISQTPKCWY